MTHTVRPLLQALAVSLVVIGSIVVSASADDDMVAEALARAPVSTSGTPFPDLEEHEMTRRCRPPRRGQQPRFYPPTALESGTPGDVVLDCAIGADGRMQSCQVIHASPEGRGFDDSALRIACHFNMPPERITADAPSEGPLPRGSRYYRGSETEPWRVRVPIRFRVR